MKATILQGFLFLLLIGGPITSSWRPGFAATLHAAGPGFSFTDTAGQHLDIRFDGHLVARYMYAYDTSTPQRREETYKPYLHVFDAEGRQPITKGPGGLYTHHRGIFIGWMKITFGDHVYDRWHMKGGEIVHQKFLAQKASADEAAFTSLVHWNEPDGRAFLVEQRTMTFHRGPDSGRLMIDFHTKLAAPRGEVTLDGDPEHAGVQYRPANEVDGKQTVYVFPREKADCHKDLDYPWVGESYVLKGKKYSIIDLNHPGNPRKTRFSAYRDYGRFGAFPAATIKKGQSLNLDYRFLVFDGEMPAPAAIQKWWDKYAQMTAPSPVPMVSVVPVEQPAAKLAKPVLMAGQGSAQGDRARTPAANDLTAEEARTRRMRMVDEEIVAAGVKNPRVIAAMRATPRHEFVPGDLWPNAYYDMALPIGEGQTISPPFIVAYMTEVLDPQPKDKVLEIGTGSGYQAAVLSGLVQAVYSIEIVEPLGKRAAKTLKRLKYENVYTKVGDGYLGWPEHSPFDKIIVTCSPEKVPQALVDQLKEGGRMVIPVGQRYQQTLYLLKKTNGKMLSESLLPTIFVPMTGKAEENRKVKPDPKNPALQNGDFEQVIGDPPQAAGWHYQRQMEVVAAGDAPSGKRYVRFHNAEPGRGAQALQAFAVDGRYVRQLEVSVRARYHDIRPDPAAQQQPLVEVLFYDANRATISDQRFGSPRGSNDWKKETKKIDVPVRAREAILRIGLFGATGELSLDDVQMMGLP